MWLLYDACFKNAICYINETNMCQMFDWCDTLINLNLSNFNAQNVTDMGWIFNGCKAFISLDLANFNAKILLIMTCIVKVPNH